MSSNGERKIPKWQRCLLIASSEIPAVIGRTAWALVGSEITDFVSIATSRDMPCAPCIRLNLLHTNGKTIVTYCRNVELLARDENDFADEVPLVSFEDWLKEGEKP